MQGDTPQLAPESEVPSESDVPAESDVRCGIRRPPESDVPSEPDVPAESDVTVHTNDEPAPDAEPLVAAEHWADAPIDEPDHEAEASLDGDRRRR